MAADMTIQGCPLSTYLSLQSICSATSVPPCATATPATAWDASCCSSQYSWGLSLASCYSKNAPSCLDTSVTGSITASAGATNVCAQFNIGATPTNAASTTVAPGSSGTVSGSSPSKTNAAGKVNAIGLKVYIGAALIGALAVLNL